MDIKQLLEFFTINPFWGIDSIKECNPNSYQDFTTIYHLPNDYIQLLTITDGFVLFHSGDFIIYDIAQVLKYNTDPLYSNNFKDSILHIGFFLERNIVIDQRKADTDYYLFAGDCCSTDEFVCLGTITDFLNGLARTLGKIPFWDEGGPYWDFGVNA